MRAFAKDTVRSIGHSLGRFFAILLIVALGSGFYAGLRMTGEDMRAAEDDWVDGTKLYDLRLVSTLGFSDENVDAIADTEGISAVMTAKTCDAMMEANGLQMATRISTLPESASDSWSDDGVTVGSHDPDYLNRAVLAQGSWPTAPDECVMSADCITTAPIEVGDTITVLYGATDLDGVLETRTFTVTGLVHSSAYITNVSMGSTSIGTGDIDQIMFVPASAFDADCPYTEVFCSVSGAEGELDGSDAYWGRVGTVEDALEDLAPALAQARYDQISGDAQSEVDDARADLASARADADAQFADAQAQLDSARAELEDSQAQLDDAQAQIASGREQLSSAQAQLDDATAQLAQAESDWQAQRESLVAQKADLESQLAETQQQKETLSGQLAQLEQIPEAMLTEEQRAQIESLREGIAQLDQGIEQLSAGIGQIDAGIAEGDAKIQAAHDEIDAGQATVDANREKLSQSESQFESGKAQLEEGWAEYNDGVAELEQQRSDAEQSFADAEVEIADAQAEVDDIEKGDVYVLDRDLNVGVRSYMDDAQRIDNISYVFPLFFFLVAALVALTTMTRMVEEERQVIGTYKALGYSRPKILSKYLIYATLASAIGAALGIGVLAQVLPRIIMESYDIIYNVPITDSLLPYDWSMALLSAGAGIGVTIVSTFVAVMATLREQPAALMLPRVPKPGKRILLEKITPIWSKVSFSWKVSARNLFRYRRRFWMTIIGIAGCTALLLTGFGLYNSIWDIIDKQYGEIVQYRMIVGMKDDATSEDVASAERILADAGYLDNGDVVFAQRTNLQISSDDASSESVSVTVPKDTGAFRSIINMRDRKTKTPISFDSDSVVIGEKLSNLLGVGVGDTIYLYEQDDIGNAKGDPHPVTVTGITENYVGNEAYIGSHVYSTVMGVDEDQIEFNTLYVPGDPNAPTDEVLVDDLLGVNGVETVSTAGEVINTYRTMLTSVNAIVYVLVAAAAALCGVVLYNLVNINITERRREIASLKVLGFNRREVHAYLYREVMILVTLGAILGLVFGVWLEGFVVVASEVDYVMFGREIHAMSFVLALALTLGFSLLILLLLGHKLDSIKMAESLKSVE